MPDKHAVRIEIYDQVYHLRPGEDSDEEQITRAAQYVDAKIRAMATKTRDVDSLRLAVLAALHIADEYHTLQARYQALCSSVEQKSAEMSRLLDRELRRAG